ncbi:MAG: hypothetical protein COV76_02035 [Candidatus Omnitrophica bacterium CG11_big_fil_rev_8_21_14_0_20_64_10]|nr:MAG: hypothetical protein COV76_02035 [Candidatus Omnitrophica bacterium CG11_big_fil_rev_8_21_14_0_20_64_10]
MLGVWLLSGPAQASASEPMPDMRYIAGEITWVDVKLGELQLRDEAPRGSRAITEYRINRQATNVTDPSDKKFLTLGDLRPGQRVAIEFEMVGSQQEKMARKITVEPTPEPAFQEAFGDLEAIDVNAGTFVLEEKPAARREGGRGDLSYFAFEPREIVVMKSPSREPVRLELNPGDPVKVEYVVKGGKRWAHSMTLYSAFPEVVGETTTTTTTTSTTTTR